MPYLEAIGILKIPCEPVPPKFWGKTHPLHFNTVEQGFSDIVSRNLGGESSP